MSRLAMGKHYLEPQEEDGKLWCGQCRDLFDTIEAHDEHLEKIAAIANAKAKRKPGGTKQRPNDQGARNAALDSFVGAMDELLSSFDKQKLPPTVDIHAVDFAELERTIRESPDILRSAVEMVMNQQHLMQKALVMGEAHWVMNANLIATVYCLQEINKRREGGLR